MKSMPRPFLLTIIFLPLVLLSSRQENPGTSSTSQGTSWLDGKEKLQKSLLTWQKEKARCVGDYSYQKKWSSWTGFGHETTIVIRNNQVIGRHFKSFSNQPKTLNQSNLQNGWKENENQLGQHKEGHPPKTLDQLYAEAQDLIDQPLLSFHRPILRFNSQGLLLSCFTQDSRIADDAPTVGVNISSISLAQKTSPIKELKPNTNQKQVKIEELEKEIAPMKDFAERARFTPDGHKKFKAKLNGLEEELAILKSKKKIAPTFEKWISGGKKIPEGMMFIGGSPWFNERTGKNRKPKEVYDMIYGSGNKSNPNKPKAKPGKRKSYPPHWGEPPRRQTRDFRPLPGGYGMGSGTLAQWIQKNLDRDQKKEPAPN